MTEPTEMSKLRGNQCQFSLDASIGKEIPVRSIGHSSLQRNNLSTENNFEKLLSAKIQSDAPQFTDTLQYSLKTYIVTITAIIPKEVVGPITIMIQDIHNWDTIVKEV